MRRLVLLAVSTILAGCSAASIPNGPSGSVSANVRPQAPDRGLKGASGFYAVPRQSTGAGQVLLYPGTLYAPTKTLFSFGSPQGMIYSIATDAAQNVYVANGYHTKAIDEYAPLNDVPQAEWQCKNYPYAIAFENNLIYALEDQAGNDAVSLEVFKPGNSSAIAQYQIQGLSGAGSVAADAAGNVFATGGGGIFELPHGGSSFQRMFNFYAPTVVAVDPSGDLVVQYLGRRNITHTEIYAPGKSTPEKSFRNLPQFRQLSFTQDGRRVYAAEPFPYGSGFSFYHYPSFRQIYSYSGSGWEGVMGIAASPRAPVGTW
jgi:hypothetical protein